MAESRVLPNGMYRPRSLRVDIISKIGLQDFMCHSNLEIELGNCVNFITGQNGSGKSAILMVLCVAFGCRAKTTQRANTMKDFIKTGSSWKLSRLYQSYKMEEKYIRKMGSGLYTLQLIAAILGHLWTSEYPQMMARIELLLKQNPNSIRTV